MTPPTPEARAQWRALAERATPGPWVRNGSFTTGVFVDGEDHQAVAEFETLADAEYAIASSPDRVLALLQHVERLEAEHGRLTEALEWYADPDSYVATRHGYDPPVVYDEGDRARAALARPDAGTEGDA